MLFYAQVAGAEQSGYWWLFIPPGLAVALLGTSLALLNFGIDEFINPRLRAAGLSRRRARRAGIEGADRLPRRFVLGVTPVVRRLRCRRRRRGDEPSRSPGRVTGEPLLEVSGLCVDYGTGADAVHAVIDADLVLHRGEVLGLAGESGSGKSTLAYAVTRLLRAPGMITGGSVGYYPEPGTTVDLLAADENTLRGAALVADLGGDAERHERAEPGAVHRLPAHRRAAGPPAGHEPRAERRARAAELLTMVGIAADRLGSYPHELSGGMRQRVMIAMALALEPQVVIMDEPTTALDVVTQREILEELMELRERLGFAVLFITHDLSLLVEIADSIAVMYAGRLVERAGATALFRAPRHPYSLGLLSSFPALHGPRRHLTGIPGSPPDLRLLPAGCVFHPRCSYVMDRCRTDSPPLLPLAAQGDGGDGGQPRAGCRTERSPAAEPELVPPAAARTCAGSQP